MLASYRQSVRQENNSLPVSVTAAAGPFAHASANDQPALAKVTLQKPCHFSKAAVKGVSCSDWSARMKTGHRHWHNYRINARQTVATCPNGA